MMSDPPVRRTSTAAAAATQINIHARKAPIERDGKGDDKF